MSDDNIVGAGASLVEPPLVDFHIHLAQNFTAADAQKLLLVFSQILNKVIGVGLASSQFTAANPVIQHSMQAAGSLEIAAANLAQQLQQSSNIISPFAAATPGPRRMN